jgi:hypothetical protein
MKYFATSLLVCAVSILWSCSSTKTESREANDMVQKVASEPIDNTQALQGAWVTSTKNKSGQDATVTALLVDGYIAQAFYNLEEKRFDAALGGKWASEGNTFNYTFEFHTVDSTMVGKTISRNYKLDGDVVIFDENGGTWKRIDNGTPGALNGAYLITGRKRDGEISKRTPGARKTMKILSGTRFQWIAYNTETTKFSGTGGGTYTTIDGKYVENIEFFSKDGSRVGASLPFEYEIVEGEWHHSGLSSKGDPIYEIWTPRNMLDEAKSQ